MTVRNHSTPTEHATEKQLSHSELLNIHMQSSVVVDLPTISLHSFFPSSFYNRGALQTSFSIYINLFSNSLCEWEILNIQRGHQSSTGQSSPGEQRSIRSTQLWHKAVIIRSTQFDHSPINKQTKLKPYQTDDESIHHDEESGDRRE